MGSAAAQIPTTFGHELRAGLRRRLVKTYDQFRESGCDNCSFFKMDEDHERVVDCTTPNLTGIISVMDPSEAGLLAGLESKISPNQSSIKLSLPWTILGGSISRIRSTGCLGVASMAMHTIPVLSKPSFDTQNGDRYFSTPLHCSSSSSAGRFVPGCYTLAVSEALPEDLQNLCEDERVPYIALKRE